MRVCPCTVFTHVNEGVPPGHMGSLHEFRRPPRVPPRAVWGLGTELAEREQRRGRRAILEIDGLAVLCVVAEVPVAGDVVHGDVSAIVEQVKVTSDGRVRIYARRVTVQRETVQPETVRRSAQEADLVVSTPHQPTGSPSARVEAILSEMRRRRRLRTAHFEHKDDLPA
jgi:hypothetical protein